MMSRLMITITGDKKLLSIESEGLTKLETIVVLQLALADVCNDVLRAGKQLGTPSKDPSTH